MSYGSTLSSLAKYIWSLEEEFDLLNLEINKIKVWQYLRFRISQEMARQLDLFAQSHIKKTGFFEILSAVPSLLYYSLFSNPLFGNYNKKILVFNTGRKVKVNHKIIDIYTDYFVQDLKKGSFEIIEELYVNKHLTNEKNNRKHQDYQQIRTFILSRISSFKLNNSQLHFINKIENRIKFDLGVNINLKKLFHYGYLTFKYDYEFYDKLLKKRKPNQVFMVCSYGYKMALVAASKNNKIECIELQHGTMNKFHLGYSYPKQNIIDYFPDKIYFFGEYWKNCMHFPINKENKIVYGFPYFQYQKSQLKKVQKNKNNILIISQGSIGNKLSEFLWKSRVAFNFFKVTYKLHPGEYGRWETEYPYLKKLNSLENFTIIDNNNINLYTFLAQSEFVIGVYSTALYEALSFDCKVILADLPGVEYLDDLVAQDFVKLVKNEKELAYCFKNNGFKKFFSELFFA